MQLLDYLTLFAGLAFFLYGMNVMSGSLEKMAGGKLESALRKATSNPFVSFGLGAGITIAVQSSSAMTVMLVGLVNSGIMDFSQTIGVILGSNVGTTLTSWILSLMGINNDHFSLVSLLSPTYFTPIFAFIGIVLIMFAKKQKRKDLGTMMLGFSILMFGMQFMSDSVGAVKNMESFDQFIGVFRNPFSALMISTLFTGIIQSSAATVGIVQNLALTGAITYKMAIPLVLGANIGTCITAVLSAIGVNKNAKCVAVVHTYIKIIGSVLWMILMVAVSPFIGSFLERTVGMTGVALVHTLFNVMNTLVIYPLSKPLIKLTLLTVREKRGQAVKTVFLDDRLLNTPPMAIEECRNLTNEMAGIAKDALFLAIEQINNYEPQAVQKVAEYEKLTDRYEDKLGTFLVKVSARSLSEADSHAVGRMLHTIGDLERLGDHAENIVGLAREMAEKKIRFSSDAADEINIMTNAIKEIVENTIMAFRYDNVEIASHIEPLEQVIDELKKKLLARHVERVQRGECTVKLGFVFSDLITNYERISDHCSNIAVYTLQMRSSKLDAHKYLGAIKDGNNANFLNDFERYEKKYELVGKY